MAFLYPRQCMETPHSTFLPRRTFALFLVCTVLIEWANAFAIPHAMGASPSGPFRRGTIAGPSGAHNTTREIVRGLSVILMTVAVLIAIYFLFRRSRECLRQRRRRRGPQIVVPPFLRDRPSAGAVPVVFSPRTVAIVAQNPFAYSTPPSTHAVPHYIGTHVHPMSPLAAPPPAYSAAAAYRA
ncbi:hypothetical protein D9611_011049 [Ephemerocybe angulata]|uniref:Uncharacterized protein n=1 Tax=Ephemerocybe angulata TaxID=980116 RepID=A0A8H5BB30_9AGAR|nr:hypothetical protein D9611_011049 [Tulosesus angulatus]